MPIYEDIDSRGAADRRESFELSGHNAIGQ
jgi:hypothetical protein